MRQWLDKLRKRIKKVKQLAIINWNVAGVWHEALFFFKSLEEKVYFFFQLKQRDRFK